MSSHLRFVADDTPGRSKFSAWDGGRDTGELLGVARFAIVSADVQEKVAMMIEV